MAGLREQIDRLELRLKRTDAKVLEKHAVVERQQNQIAELCSRLESASESSGTSEILALKRTTMMLVEEVRSLRRREAEHEAFRASMIDQVDVIQEEFDRIASLSLDEAFTRAEATGKAEAPAAYDFLHFVGFVFSFQFLRYF